MKRLITVSAALLLLFALHSPVAGSALGDLAASMQPGTWAALTTTNISVFSGVGASGVIADYCDVIKWDPVTEQAYFLGSDHDDQPKFVCYSAATNSWRTLPKESWMAAGTGSAMHGYEHSGIDPVGRKFYHRPYASRNLYSYNIDTQVWSACAPTTGTVMEYNNCCVGLDYFPELKGIVYCSDEAGVNCSLIFWSQLTNAWTRIGPGKDLLFGSYHNFAKYNPVHKMVLFGGGNAPGNTGIYMVDSTKKVTALKNAPFGLGIHQSVNTVDPVSGEYLFINNSKQLYSYNVKTDTWALLPGTPPIIGAPVQDPPVAGILATPIGNHGVVMFVKAYNTGGRGGGTFSGYVYLYKHNGANAAERIPVRASSSGLSVRPNPFRSTVGIFMRARAGTGETARAKIFDVRGRQVADLSMRPGSRNGYECTWESGGLPGGIYLLQVVTKEETVSERLFLDK